MKMQYKAMFCSTSRLSKMIPKRLREFYFRSSGINIIFSFLLISIKKSQTHYFHTHYILINIMHCLSHLSNEPKHPVSNPVNCY